MTQGRILSLPPFRAPWWLRGAHRQTLAAAYWSGNLAPYSATPRTIPLDDGDQMVIHDDCPAAWRPGQPAVVLIHGLNGSYQSPPLVRIAAKLVGRGFRVFRWDMRGCGAGLGMARLPYHAGCSNDLARVLEAVERWCRPASNCAAYCRSLLHVVGISLSGNVLLKYLGEAPDRIPETISQAIAVNPPIDLSRSLVALQGALVGCYDRHFVGRLVQDLHLRRRKRPDAPMPSEWRQPRSMMEFDDWYTAPISGFATGRDYYNQCSASQFLSRIRVPTTIITSQDDPMVPLPMFTNSCHEWSSTIRLAVAEGGGHVGYIARRGLDPDEFWLDWRIVELITGQRAVAA